MFTEIQSEFKKNKFYVYDDFLSKEECRDLANKFYKRFEEKPEDFSQDHKQVDNTEEIYTPFHATGLKYEEKMSNIAGIPLKFSFCFGRLYKKGSHLKPHRDRDACEYSVTIPLDFDKNSNWPIKFRDVNLSNNTGTKKTYSLSQDIGNGIVYKGRELLHWRPNLTTDYSLHLFMHYVDPTGDCAKWAGEYEWKMNPRQGKYDEATLKQDH